MILTCYANLMSSPVLALAKWLLFNFSFLFSWLFLFDWLVFGFETVSLSSLGCSRTSCVDQAASVCTHACTWVPQCKCGGQSTASGNWFPRSTLRRQDLPWVFWHFADYTIDDHQACCCFPVALWEFHLEDGADLDSRTSVPPPKCCTSKGLYHYTPLVAAFNQCFR